MHICSKSSRGTLEMITKMIFITQFITNQIQCSHTLSLQRYMVEHICVTSHGDMRIVASFHMIDV